MRRAVAVLVVLAACGGGTASTSTSTTLPPVAPGDVIAIRASTDLAVGTERLLLALAGADGSRLGSPDLAMQIVVFPEEDPSAVQVVQGTWMWAIPDRSGLYRATVEFDRPGVWFAQMEPATGPEPAPVPLLVNESPTTVGVGEQAPPSVTPTAADGLDAITSDPDPDPRFYELSVADAVMSGRPTVVVFATPQFCQTAVCGPTLEIVKELTADYPEVNFVHVEVFDLAASPADATSIEDLVLAPAVLEWGLTSEPWVFVVGSDGRVAARFEGVVEPAEIAAVLS